MISVTVSPRFGSRSPVPHACSNLASHGGVVGLGVVGVEHRDQPHVRGALHVVLPAQRVQAAARTADVAGDRAQRDQAAGVVRAGGVLGDPHPPEDHAGAGLAPDPGDPADDVGGDPGDLFGPFRRIVPNGLGESLVVAGPPGDVVVVHQVQPDDLVHHGVVEGHVGARLELAVDVGVVGHLVGPRVDVDDRGAEAARLLEEARRHRVVGGGVAAGDDGHVGVDHVAVGGGDRAGADALEQGGHAGGVAQPGAVVHVVGVEPGPDQLLEEVGLLVGALGRAEAGDRGRAAGRVDLGQPAGHQVQRFLPGGLAEVRHDLGVVDQAAGLAAAAPFLGGVARHLAEHVVGERALGVGPLAADQRLGQPLRRGRVVPAVAALHAQPAVRAGLLPPLGEGDRVVLAVHVVGQRAADAAVRADRVHRVQFGARPDRDLADGLVGQRAGRAGRDALAAGDAGGVTHRVVQVERDPGGVALAAAPDDVVALDVVAGAHAPVAQDAGVMVHRDDRAGGVGSPPGGARQGRPG